MESIIRAQLKTTRLFSFLKLFTLFKLSLYSILLPWPIIPQFLQFYVRQPNSPQLQQFLFLFTSIIQRSPLILSLLSSCSYRGFLTITVFIHSILFIRVGSTNVYYIFCLLSQILSRTKEVDLAFFYFLFSFLLSFQFIFFYSIFKTRVRVRETRSCCYTEGHIR